MMVPLWFSHHNLQKWQSGVYRQWVASSNLVFLPFLSIVPMLQSIPSLSLLFKLFKSRNVGSASVCNIILSFVFKYLICLWNKNEASNNFPVFPFYSHCTNYPLWFITYGTSRTPARSLLLTPTYQCVSSALPNMSNLLLWYKKS